MYKQEVPAIVSWLEDEGPDGIVTVGSFVLCTIQTPLSRVGEQLDDIRQNGLQSVSLWGNKRGGYYHMSLFRKELYDLLLGRSESREETFYRVLATPGLGLAKTAFLMQLCGWETSCLDSHNIKRLGLPDQKLSMSTKPATKHRKIAQYLALCDSLGTSEWFWDDWCSYVAGNRMNKELPTAEAVSKYHYEAIAGG